MSKLITKEIFSSKLKNPEFVKECDKKEIAYQIGKEIKRSRFEKKITQHQLAELSGTTQTIISRIENMQARPSLGMLSRLARSVGKKLEIRFAERL